MNNYRLIENNSEKYHNGSEWINKSGQKFKIVGKTDKMHNKGYPYYLCKFEDGTLIEVKYNHITDGQVKNPNYPSVCGIGYLGRGEWSATKNSKRTKEYNLWIRIINCCYNKNYKDYINYGKKGVKVNSRWHNFQLFCEDIVKIKGYENWKDGNYELDKDIMCEKLNISPKVYSKNTCVFIPKTSNSIQSNLTGLTYVATRRSDGYEEEFINMVEFAKKYNLQQQNISSCIRGRVSQHKGWTFKVK